MSTCTGVRAQRRHRRGAADRRPVAPAAPGCDTGLIIVRKILTCRMACDILVATMITSKITSKAQTTIPQPVRAALHVGEGDELAYRIEGDHVILTKAKREPIDDPFATFHEWSSEADWRAYGDL